MMLTDQIEKMGKTALMGQTEMTKSTETLEMTAQMSAMASMAETKCVKFEVLVFKEYVDRMKGGPNDIF